MPSESLALSALQGDHDISHLCGRIERATTMTPRFTFDCSSPGNWHHIARPDEQQIVRWRVRMVHFRPRSSCPALCRASTEAREADADIAWMAGTSPRVSGLDWVPLERQLSRIERRRRLDLKQTVEAPAMHQIGAHEPGEGEWAGDRVLRCLSHAQQQKGDQGDGDLDAHGVFAGAEKAADLEALLDPAEEQFDRPAALVELGDLLGRRGRWRGCAAPCRCRAGRALRAPGPGMDWAGCWTGAAADGRCGRRGWRCPATPAVPRPPPTGCWI
jgi:hypothetical protein